MALEKVRVLSKHPSYKKEDVPCILIAGKEIAKKYGWKVGDRVIVVLEEDSVRIIKPTESVDSDEIQENTTSLEEKEEKIKEIDEPKKEPKNSGS